MDIEIEGLKVLDGYLEEFPRETGIALLRALKRGTSSAATKAGRVVAQDTGLKVGDVRKRIRVIEPNGQTLAGEIRASLKRVPRVEFGARGPEPSRGRGRGVSYRPKGRLPHAFLATMPGGHRGVFERSGGKRLPIRELFGPSVGRVVDLHSDEILGHGASTVEQELERLLNRLIEKKR